MSELAVPAHVPPDRVRDFGLFAGEGMARARGGDPHAAIGRLHDDGPGIFWAPNNTYDGRGTWMVIRAADQRAILQDAARFSSARGIFAAALGESLPMVPLELDPPVHGAFRSLLNPLLSPRRVEEMAVGARERARDLVDGLVARGRCEVMAEFAFPFAVGVFLQFLGLPESRRDEFLSWADRQFHGTPAERLAAMRTVVDFMRALVAQRRAEPTDDFVSFLLAASVKGDDGPRLLTTDEVVGVAVLLFEAGLDTVAAAIGFDLAHLAREADDQRRLRDAPDAIPAAVEELLRAYSTVQMLRVATCDVEYHGVLIRKGDLVSCPTMAANRDPAEFPDPDRIDLARDSNRHTAFAYGPHRCLGSHLARRELVIALEEFLARVPAFRLDPDMPPVTYGGHVFGIEDIRLQWTPPPCA